MKQAEEGHAASSACFHPLIKFILPIEKGTKTHELFPLW